MVLDEEAELALLAAVEPRSGVLQAIGIVIAARDIVLQHAVTGECQDLVEDSGDDWIGRRGETGPMKIRLSK